VSAGVLTLSLAFVPTAFVPTASAYSRPNPVNLMAIVANHGTKNYYTDALNDVLVAKVTAMGSPRVLATKRILHGRRSFNPSDVSIAPKTHLVAVVATTDEFDSDHALAVMREDGSHLRILLRLTNTALLHPQWDASGTRLLITAWDDTNDGNLPNGVYEFDTRRQHPTARLIMRSHDPRVYVSASFVGGSTTKVVALNSSAGLVGDRFDLRGRGGAIAPLRTFPRTSVYDVSSSPSGRAYTYIEWVKWSGDNPISVIRVAAFGGDQQPRIVRWSGSENFDPSDPVFSPGETRVFYTMEQDLVPMDAVIHWVDIRTTVDHIVEMHDGYSSHELGSIVSF
jgi:hypothetical protein